MRVYGDPRTGQIRLAPPKDHPRYKVTLQEHIDAIDDAETLHASVLLHSYALAEAAAANRLAMNSRTFGGIEEWGARLLRANGRDWINVSGGLAGAVEIAVTRNAFAHGSRTLDVERPEPGCSTPAPSRDMWALASH